MFFEVFHNWLSPKRLGAIVFDDGSQSKVQIARNWHYVRDQTALLRVAPDDLEGFPVTLP